jgi:hypothetical protein
MVGDAVCVVFFACTVFFCKHQHTYDYSLCGGHMLQLEVFDKIKNLDDKVKEGIWEWCCVELIWPTIKNLEGVTHEDWVSLSRERLQTSFAKHHQRCVRSGINIAYNDMRNAFLNKKSNYSTTLGRCNQYEIKPEVLQMLIEHFVAKTTEEIVASIEKKYCNTQLGKTLAAYSASKNNPKGRRYLRGGINLQNCSSKIRRELTAGAYEYDVESCHISLLQNYALRIGIDSPILDSMIWGKRELRQRIANECEISLADAKTLIQALTYGAQMTPTKNCHKVLGAIIKDVEKQQKFVELIRPYKNILNECIERLLTEFQDPDMNWVRKNCKSESKATQIFRFLECKEWNVLMMIAQSVNHQIWVLQHDGLTSPACINTEIIEQDIQERLGLHLMIDAKEVADAKS